MEVNRSYLDSEKQKVNSALWDTRFARFNRGCFVAFSVGGSAAVLGGAASELYDALPSWANITSVIGGLILGSTSIAQLPMVNKWVKDADKAYEEQKERFQKLESGQEVTIQQEKPFLIF